MFDHVGPWLPSDMETVYVTNMPIRGLFPGPSEPVLDGYARLAVSALAEVKNAREIGDALANLDATEALYSGRRFRFVAAPGGLGGVGRFEGCSFLHSSRAALDEELRALDTKHVEVVMGITLYRLPAREDSLKGATVATPEPDLLMICTDRSLAQEILERKGEGSPRDAFRSLYLEKDWVDTNTPAWGFRQFRPGKTDSTSPLSPAPGILPE